MSHDIREDLPYDEEPAPRHGERPPRREPPAKSRFPWPLLIVGGVLGFMCCIGGGLVFVWVFNVRESAARQVSSNNLRQIGLAAHNCNDNFGELPLVSGPWKGIPATATVVQRSLFFCLLPYVEQDNLYKNVLNARGATTDVLVKTYVSPRDSTGNGAQGECSYAANWQVFQQTATFGANTVPLYCSIPRSFPDGERNVIMFAEIYQNCNGTVRKWGQTGAANSFSTPAFNRQTPWNPSVINTQLEMFQLEPKQNNCLPPLAQTPHSSGMLVCLGDGSVRQLTGKLSLTTWRQACAPADKNVLGSDW